MLGYRKGDMVTNNKEGRAVWKKLQSRTMLWDGDIGNKLLEGSAYPGVPFVAWSREETKIAFRDGSGRVIVQTS